MTGPLPDTADTVPDLGWFRTNPTANYRVRAPRPGEVDQLARAFVPAGAAWEAGLTAPADSAWSVLVIRLPLRRVARVLTLATATADGGFRVLPVAFADRLAIS